MGEWTAIAVSLGIALILGLIFAEIGTEFNIQPEENFIITPLVNFIDNGVDLFLFQFNIFDILGDGFKNYMISGLNAMTIIPSVLLYPIIIFIFVIFVYGIIKVLPTT